MTKKEVKYLNRALENGARLQYLHGYTDQWQSSIAKRLSKPSVFNYRIHPEDAPNFTKKGHRKVKVEDVKEGFIYVISNGMCSYIEQIERVTKKLIIPVRTFNLARNYKGCATSWYIDIIESIRTPSKKELKKFYKAFPEAKEEEEVKNENENDKKSICFEEDLSNLSICHNPCTFLYEDLWPCQYESPLEDSFQNLQIGRWYRVGKVAFKPKTKLSESLYRGVVIKENNAYQDECISLAKGKEYKEVEVTCQIKEPFKRMNHHLDAIRYFPCGADVIIPKGEQIISRSLNESFLKKLLSSDDQKSIPNLQKGKWYKWKEDKDFTWLFRCFKESCVDRYVEFDICMDLNDNWVDKSPNGEYLEIPLNRRSEIQHATIQDVAYFWKKQEIKEEFPWEEGQSVWSLKNGKGEVKHISSVCGKQNDTLSIKYKIAPLLVNTYASNKLIYPYPIKVVPI